ncbi:M48 family metalloprotease [Priestia megaterium]|uniref:hypothetical protein n=1 Tax=Priestia megaterium TaxID=1404 RepID=UPI0012B86EF6|nr:hypothetical protein [Priestia megaterium]
MTKNVEKQFFELYPDAFQNYIIEYLEGTLQKSAPQDLKNTLEKQYEEFKLIHEENYAWFSNDLFTHNILANIIEGADEEIKEELEKVWIGKLNDNKVNATAHTINPDFEGYLISLDSELDFLLHNVCNTFAGEMVMCTNKDEKYHSAIFLLFFSNYISLPDLNEQALFIRDNLLSPEIVKKLNNAACAALVAATTFIIAHEIGHHFMKHTEVNNEFIAQYRDMHVRGGNINHEYEYSADDFAIDLMLKNKKYLPDGYMGIEYLAGPLLVMLTLAFEDSEPHLACNSHPSIKDRFKNIKNRIASAHKDEEVVEALFALMNRMIEFINDSVKRGQPKRWNDKEWWK